jgi:hypothetical protein
MLIMNYLLGAVDLWVMVQRKWRSVMAGCILMAPPGVVLPQLHGADSTIYTVFPEAIITALSTKTLHGQGSIIPAGVDSAVPVLSSDGNTFYVAAPSGPTYSNGQIIAVDRLNGKTLHTYTRSIPSGIRLVLPWRRTNPEFTLTLVPVRPMDRRAKAVTWRCSTLHRARTSP